MCQVTTTWEVETHDAVMGVEQSCVDCKVGWTAAGMKAQLWKQSMPDSVQAAHLPEYGCTLTVQRCGSKWKACRALALQRFSILSMFSLPP